MSNEFFHQHMTNQGSMLNLHLFILIINKFSNHLHDRILWYTLFIDDIILVDERLSENNYKLEVWRKNLETKGFRLSWTKTLDNLYKIQS